jgi:hypothetical protein
MLLHASLYSKLECSSGHKTIRGIQVEILTVRWKRRSFCNGHDVIVAEILFQYSLRIQIQYKYKYQHSLHHKKDLIDVEKILYYLYFYTTVILYLLKRNTLGTTIHNRTKICEKFMSQWVYYKYRRTRKRRNLTAENASKTSSITIFAACCDD